MNRDDGGPAFPQDPGWGGASTCKGMSLRDYFAAAALQGMVSGITRLSEDNPGVEIVNYPQDLAEMAYQCADCLIEARKK